MKKLEGIERFTRALTAIPYVAKESLLLRPMAKVRFCDGLRADFDLRDGAVVVDCANKNFMQPIHVSLAPNIELEDFIARATLEFTQAGISTDVDQYLVCRRENGVDGRKVQTMIDNLKERIGMREKRFRGMSKEYWEECKKLWGELITLLRTACGDYTRDNGWEVVALSGVIRKAKLCPDWNDTQIFSFLKQAKKQGLVKIVGGHAVSTKSLVLDSPWPNFSARKGSKLGVKKEKAGISIRDEKETPNNKSSIIETIIAAIAEKKDLMMVCSSLFKGMSSDDILTTSLVVGDECEREARDFTSVASVMRSYYECVENLQKVSGK